MIRRYGRCFAAFMLFFAVALAGCGAKEPPVVATVDGEEISREQFQAYINIHWRIIDPERSLSEDEKREMLDNMIVDRLLYEEALDREYETDREAATEEYEEFAQLNIERHFEDSEHRYQARLQELNLTADDILGWIERYQIIGEMLTDVRNGVPQPTADEVEAFYEQHKGDFIRGERREVRAILINERSPVEEDRDPEELAWDIYQQLLAGGDFAQLAATYSADEQSRDNGGLLGTYEEKDLLPQLADIVFSLEPGEVGEPVETENGWNIVEVLQVMEPENIPIEEMFDQIYDFLWSTAKEQRVNRLIENLQRDADIDIKL